MSAWLWAFVSAHITVYMITAGRGFEEATQVLPKDFAGVLIRDGWAPYRRFGMAAHKTCAAHLLRRAHELHEKLPAGRSDIPARLTELLHEALVVRAVGDGGAYETDGRFADAVTALWSDLALRPSTRLGLSVGLSRGEVDTTRADVSLRLRSRSDRS